MAAIDVFLELREDGQCIAHVLEMPGCFVVGHDAAAALDKIPDAVQAYVLWLRDHGETVDHLESITCTTVESVGGTGALYPGDRMALFAPEKAPLTRDELERYLHLAAYNRADLLAAVRGLSGTIRRWHPAPDRMSIDDILYHIGRADRWYISRLKDEAALPADWFATHDGVPVLQFLRQAHERAVDQFRHLSDNELSCVFTPAYGTDNLTEPWSARKALRRFLEHEREHLAQIQENLALWRQQLNARLAAERAYFLLQYGSLSEEVLSQQPVHADWTAKDLLPHVAAWDVFHTERLEKVGNGRLSDIDILNKTILDNRNAQLHHEMKDLPLEQAYAVCLKERSAYKAMLDRLPDGELHRVIRLPNGERTTIAVWANRRWRHDAAHGDELAAWRSTLPRELLRGIGPKFLLQGILHATRKAFLALAPLLSERERDERPVCGVWTLKDVVGHLVDWEKVGIDGLRQLADGQTPEFEEAITDFDAFNHRHAAARKDQPWAAVWADFEASRAVLLDLLQRVGEGDLKRPFTAPWGQHVHGYYFTITWAVHDVEHAADVRQALQLPGLPRRLRSYH